MINRFGAILTNSYSLRRATAGSTFEACRVGMKQAITATSTRKSETAQTGWFLNRMKRLREPPRPR
jgi:hypothetical protein